MSIEPKYTPVKYQTVSNQDTTNIVITIPDRSRKGGVIFIEYEVDRIVVDERLIFPISSYTTITDLLTVIIFEQSDSMIEYDSVNISPSPTVDTYSLTRSEIGRSFVYYIFENVRSTSFNLNLHVSKTIYDPDYFIQISSVLAFLTSLSLAFMFRPIEKRVNFFTLAFRDFSREKGRYMMAVIGVSIYGALLSSTVIQSQVLLREISVALGIEHAPKIEPYLFLAIAISIVVGSFLILNSILTSFLERINEFGIMKAIGFSPSFFFKLTIFESTLIGVTGGLLGCSLGVFLSLTPYLTFRAYLPLNYPSNLHLMFVIVLTAIGLFIGRILGKRWKTAFICGIVATIITFFVPIAASFNASTIPVTGIMSDTMNYYFLLLISSVLISIISGLYPAYWISKIQPVDAIRKTV
jgi:ABC-type antimicrobial peptide transport system permease subunit